MRYVSAVVIAILLSPLAAVAAEPVDYRKDVKPILQARCYACHGALAQKAKLRIDSGASMLARDVVVPGKPDASPLVERIASADQSHRMPPEGHPLKPEEIARIRDWIAQGVKVPADDTPELDPRDHWSFRTPQRPPVPAVAPPRTIGGRPFAIANPIDAFVAAKWHEHNLKPVNAADRKLLLRRVYLDLVGLPPSAAEIDAFMKDASPDAYEKVVDKLLASPQYGERWGRHFLDIWRYSDWWGLGAELRNSQRHIWHWRDWVVESFNADLGYDEMIRQMLAADELYPTDPLKLRATGYLARSYFLFNRTTWLDEVVEHTGKAFLGLTFNCCKCHDHKYDPIRQLDYYRFRAIFEPYQVRTDLVPSMLDAMKDGIPRAFDCNLDVKTPFHIRGDERNPDPQRDIVPGLPPFLAPNGIAIAPVKLPLFAYRPGSRPDLLEGYRQAALARIAKAKDELSKARAKFALATAEAKKPKTVTEENILVHDAFSQANPDRWETGPGMWKYERGRLVQPKTGGDRSYLRLKSAIPADFDATFTFTITGGDPYKSVGIAFDVGEGNEVLVYVSAYSGGNKLQVAYKKGADYIYPAEGALAIIIPLDKPMTLGVRVRGTLVNASLDGKFALAYTLPIPRKSGKLDLITYTASAEFTKFELRELPAEIALRSPGDTGLVIPSTPEIAYFGFLAAERKLTVAEAELEAVNARTKADRSGVKDDARLAAMAEKLQRILTLESTLADGEYLKHAGVPIYPLPTDFSIAIVRKDAETIDEKYSPMVGAVKSAESNVESAASRTRPFPDISTGRRTALAKWLGDASNPLTARVAVNHVWLRHFGKPLVANVFDFGRKGTLPSHPELLDYLAVELMEHDWSFKHLHRLIVTSNVYRLSSSAAAADADVQADPENRYLWRMNSVRMEAQTVRDSLLHLAGDLDLARGGPPVPLAEQDDSRRRSMYFFHSHNEHNRLLDVFDNANVLECYRRTESIVPQQALALWNSRLAQAMSGKINDALHARLGTVDDARFITAAFETILGATPTADELAICLEMLGELRTALKDLKDVEKSKRARLQLVQALVNHNDFVTVR